MRDITPPYCGKCGCGKNSKRNKRNKRNKNCPKFLFHFDLLLYFIRTSYKGMGKEKGYIKRKKLLNFYSFRYFDEFSNI